MNIQAKRKLKEVLRGLIGDGFVGTQTDIAKHLKGKGFKITQSTVSRTLNEMGVIKELVMGKQIYRTNNNPINSYRGSLSDQVLSIQYNEMMIVVKTKPGSAMFVAGFIDHECRSTVLGTIAGDDTIFVSPVKVAKLSATLKEISKILN
jgi:transcriptional regulator of arginine metabolism